MDILYDNVHISLLTSEGVWLVYNIVTKLLKSKSICRHKQTMTKNKSTVRQIMG